MSSPTDVVTPLPTDSRLTGRVKWFNNKAGYGFISVTDGSQSGSDVFVHHSAISVENQQYKYLVQGEYVEFSVVNVSSGTHTCQASNVVGVNGGKLMCETRYEFKMSRINYKASNAVNTESEKVVQPRQRTVPRETKVATDSYASKVRARGEGPRDGVDKKGWTLVQKTTEKPRRGGKSSAKASTIESK